MLKVLTLFFVIFSESESSCDLYPIPYEGSCPLKIQRRGIDVTQWSIKFAKLRIKVRRLCIRAKREEKLRYTQKRRRCEKFQSRDLIDQRGCHKLHKVLSKDYSHGFGQMKKPDEKLTENQSEADSPNQFSLKTGSQQGPRQIITSAKK